LPTPGGFAGGGGTAMRKVSFLGSFESAMRRGEAILKIARKSSSCHSLT
jgi:hypothetical protein